MKLRFGIDLGGSKIEIIALDQLGDPLLRRRVPTLDTDRWFSNLETRGNTGSASIFIALEEAWRTGRFAPGETVLLAVPESGRFSFAFAHLTVVAPPNTQGAPK